MFDVCTMGDTAHIDMNLNIVSVCAVSPVVHTSNISSCQKNLLSFPVAVNNSITVGSLVFLLQMFVVTENIMKRLVYRNRVTTYRTVCCHINHMAIWTNTFNPSSLNVAG
jgi:hypothetical protein